MSSGWLLWIDVCLPHNRLEIALLIVPDNNGFFSPPSCVTAVIWNFGVYDKNAFIRDAQRGLRRFSWSCDLNRDRVGGIRSGAGFRAKSSKDDVA